MARVRRRRRRRLLRVVDAGEQVRRVVAVARTFFVRACAIRQQPNRKQTKWNVPVPVSRASGRKLHKSIQAFIDSPSVIDENIIGHAFCIDR